MRTSDNEAVRLSCLESLRSIGPFVSEKFCEIVKLRNQLAKKLGYVDFYDMKVTQAEGFSKEVLFSILDGLEAETRPIMQQAWQTLSADKGMAALEPHNTNYLLSGDLAKRKDPYFPFEDAVDIWARSFAALNISYRGATMRLDLCDRPGKYSNGFCHWPQPAWYMATIPVTVLLALLLAPSSYSYSIYMYISERVLSLVFPSILHSLTHSFALLLFCFLSLLSLHNRYLSPRLHAGSRRPASGCPARRTSPVWHLQLLLAVVTRHWSL